MLSLLATLLFCATPGPNGRDQLIEVLDSIPNRSVQPEQVTALEAAASVLADNQFKHLSDADAAQLLTDRIKTNQQTRPDGSLDPVFSYLAAELRRQRRI